MSLAVDPGKIAGLIGPNGAGKTTAFNVITRLYQPDAGRVVFDGKDPAPHAAAQDRRARRPRTFQNVVLFPLMTVLENVLVGTHSQHGSSRSGPHVATPTRCSRTSGWRRSRPAGRRAAVRHAEADRARPRARSRPRLLLLDEPAGGLNHEEVEELGALIRRVKADYDLTILLVEHHVNLVMRSPTASTSSTSARRSPRARPPRCAPTRP